MFDAPINANKSAVPTPSEALDLMRQEIAAHQQQNDQKSYVASGISAITGVFRADSLGSVEKLHQDLQDATSRGDSEAARKLAAQATDLVKADQSSMRLDQQFDTYGSGMVKTAGMFLPGRAGWAIAAATGVMDQARPSDTLSTQLTDGGLGLAKGLSLKVTFNKIGGADLNIATKALSLGVGSRIIDSSLTRQTYQTADGSYSAMTGISRIGEQSFNKTALASDLITFGLAHGAVSGINSITGGALRSSPFTSTIATGGIFGVSSGSVQEINRQQQAGEKFDISKVLTSAAITGLTDTVASAPGARMMSFKPAEINRSSSPTDSNVEQKPITGIEKIGRIEFPIKSENIQRNFAGSNSQVFQLVDAHALDQWRQNPATPVMADVQAVGGSGVLGPKIKLAVEHNSNNGTKLGLENPAILSAADILATCNPNSLSPEAFAKHVMPTADSLYLTANLSGRLTFSENYPTTLKPGDMEPVKLGGQTVSELLAGKGVPDYLDNTHDRAAIAKAMKHFKTPVRYVNGGADSIVFELPDHNILKITDHGWDPAWGSREIQTSHGPQLIDAPVIQKPHHIDMEDAAITYFVQQRLRTPVTEQGVRIFNAAIEQDGRFKFWDNDFKEHGRGQLGIDPKTKRIYLLDYDAVRTPDRVPQGQVDGSSWWANRYFRSGSSSDISTGRKSRY